MAAAYSASKAAVIGMTKSFGKDLATTGVLVNCIAPAVIATPILEQLSQEHVDYMVSRIPMGRMGRPEEVAELIAFLAERPDDVLDRRDVRHLRGPRGLLRTTGATRRRRVATRTARRVRRSGTPSRASRRSCARGSPCSGNSSPGAERPGSARSAPCASKAALSRYCSYMRKTRGSSGSRWAM